MQPVESEYRKFGLSSVTFLVSSATGYPPCSDLHLHPQKRIVVLSYTIANERISFKERNSVYGNSETLQYPGPLQIRIKQSCLHDLSILNVDGRMMVETDINYHPNEAI